MRGLAIPVEWQEAVIRSAITLKLCTYEDTGAVLAALTTSIPEHAGSERNWDYRYCWLRDSYFVIQALNRLGATRTMEAYLRYIDNVSIRTQGEPLQPLYGMAGETQITEWIATGLAGYRGMGPVRVGNLAYLQRQNDVYGAVVLAAAQSFFDQRLSAPGDHGLFQRLERLGERAAEIYRQPDSGPWEFRGMERTHTFSAAMCWAGCDRLYRIASVLGLKDRADALGPSCAAQHARNDPATRRGTNAPGVLGQLRRRRARRDLGAAARARHRERDGPALPEHARGRRARTEVRRLAVSLSPPRRFRHAGHRVHDLRVLVRERAGRGRPHARKRASTSSACSIAARRSDCCRRTSNPAPASSGATSRRPTAWSASSTAPCD